MKMKLDEVKNIIKESKIELERNFKVKEIGIFGSYIRGEQKDKSDVDILVELDEPVSLLGLVKLENYLSDLLHIKVDLIPKKDIRQELRERILRETVYL
jgi:predicted nucleotidyltransferase